MNVDRDSFVAKYGELLTPDEWHPLYNELLELDAILRWIEAGFPPWGCDNCRGAEYGPDGRPCPACDGHSERMEPPSRAQAIKDQFEQAIRHAVWASSPHGQLTSYNDGAHS